MKKLILLIILLLPSQSRCQGFIDTVYSFLPGTVQSAGQSSEFFPMNIFGPPSSDASWTVPASLQSDVCSIGIGGEIIVGLKSGKIYNGTGPDFIIFENAFYRLPDSVIFAEPAIISVSQNGIDFIDFPYDESTLQGLAGKSPTNGKANPFNYLLSGGDAFDMDDLHLDYITHIKIKDISLIITKDESHPFYQPEFMVTGFDLDAVSAIYTHQTTAENWGENSDFSYRETTNQIQIIANGELIVQVFDLLGEKLFCKSSDSILIIDKNRFASGMILLRITVNNRSNMKIILI